VSGALYAASVWLHVVAAATWVGSMVFFSAVLVPVLRKGELRGQGTSLVELVGRRYRVLGWIALAVLIVTGTVNLYFRGIGLHLLASSAFWATSFGRALAWKLALVAVVLVLTALHELGAHNRRVASWIGRSLLLISLAILFFAAALVRGFF
jgi:uncharacterized membrane protein